MNDDINVEEHEFYDILTHSTWSKRRNIFVRSWHHKVVSIVVDGNEVFVDMSSVQRLIEVLQAHIERHKEG